MENKIIGGARPPRAQPATPSSLATRGGGFTNFSRRWRTQSSTRGRVERQPGRLRSPSLGCRHWPPYGVAGLSFNTSFAPLHEPEIGELTPKMKAQIEDGLRMVTERIQEVTGQP